MASECVRESALSRCGLSDSLTHERMSDEGRSREKRCDILTCFGSQSATSHSPIPGHAPRTLTCHSPPPPPPLYRDLPSRVCRQCRQARREFLRACGLLCQKHQMSVSCSVMPKCPQGREQKCVRVHMRFFQRAVSFSQNSAEW